MVDLDAEVEFRARLKNRGAGGCVSAVPSRVLDGRLCVCS